MLPNPDDPPASLAEQSIGILIAQPIFTYFTCPVVSIRLGSRMVFGATMPEAPVEQNNDSGSRED
jgi:hypothetical protein